MPAMKVERAAEQRRLSTPISLGAIVPLLPKKAANRGRLAGDSLNKD